MRHFDFDSEFSTSLKCTTFLPDIHQSLTFVYFLWPTVVFYTGTHKLLLRDKPKELLRGRELWSKYL